MDKLMTFGWLVLVLPLLFPLAMVAVTAPIWVPFYLYYLWAKESQEDR